MMEKQGIGSLDAGASNITYEGNEGPKSPAEEMKMASMMSDIAEEFEIEHGYDMAVANPEMREAFIREWLKNNFYNKTDIPFRRPSGIKLIKVNPKTGLMVNSKSKHFILEAFKPGQLPSLTTDLNFQNISKQKNVIKRLSPLY